MSQKKCSGCGELQIVNKKGSRVKHSKDCPFRQMKESIQKIESLLEKEVEQ